MKSILAVLLILLSSFAVSEEACIENISESQAIGIAETFLSNQKWKNQFHQKAEYTTELGCIWVVWFKNVKWQTIKPSRGKISISKQSGEAIWLPSM